VPLPDAAASADSRPEFDFSIDLPIRSDWSNVELIRNAILGCFRAAFAHLDGCERMAMVAGELMENAIKYGNWNEGQRQLRLRIHGYEDDVEITVDSPVDPASPCVRDLFATLAFLRSFATPGEAYQARMLKIAEDPVGAGSKLGLIRIAYEGDCGLEAELAGRTLRVRGGMDLRA
jgi:hypothetical protein